MSENVSGNWTSVAEKLPNRSGKQCRERWHNHLNPGIKKGDWTEEEDRLIVTMQKAIGNQWAKITKLLPGRTDNAVKNRYHATVRARLRFDKDDDMSSHISDTTPIHYLDENEVVPIKYMHGESGTYQSAYEFNPCTANPPSLHEEAYSSGGMVSPVNMVIGIGHDGSETFVPYFETFPSPPLPDGTTVHQQPIAFASSMSPPSQYASVMTLPMGYIPPQDMGENYQESSGDFAVHNAVLISSNVHMEQQPLCDELEEQGSGSSAHLGISIANPSLVSSQAMSDPAMSYSPPLNPSEFAVDEEYFNGWLSSSSMDDQTAPSEKEGTVNKYGLEVEPCFVLPFSFGQGCIGDTLFTNDLSSDSSDGFCGSGCGFGSSFTTQAPTPPAPFKLPQMCGLESWTMGGSICPQPKQREPQYTPSHDIYATGMDTYYSHCQREGSYIDDGIDHSYDDLQMKKEHSHFYDSSLSCGFGMRSEDDENMNMETW